ncbi:MAG: MbcA/ParS/Xre antitoxin family protein [Bacteroidota bacterium]
MEASATSIVSPIMFIQQAEEGVNTAQIDTFLQNSGLHKTELAELLSLDPKTLENYRKKNKHLDTLRSELLLKLVDLFPLGKEVLGDQKSFRAWLALPAGEFEGATPWQLLSTVTGVGEVQDQLTRIACGYAV